MREDLSIFRSKRGSSLQTTTCLDVDTDLKGMVKAHVSFYVKLNHLALMVYMLA